MSDVQIASFQLQAYPDQSKADLSTALDNLLMQKIFVIQAERDSVYVSDEEVDQELMVELPISKRCLAGWKIFGLLWKTITELNISEDIFDQPLSSQGG